jgi:cation transport ATPase
VILDTSFDLEMQEIEADWETTVAGEEIRKKIEHQTNQEPRVQIEVELALEVPEVPEVPEVRVQE